MQLSSEGPVVTVSLWILLFGLQFVEGSPFDIEKGNIYIEVINLIIKLYKGTIQRNHRCYL